MSDDDDDNNLDDDDSNTNSTLISLSLVGEGGDIIETVQSSRSSTVHGGGHSDSGLNQTVSLLCWLSRGLGSSPGCP